MYKINFVRITTEGETSLHDEFPLTQSHDVVLRFEIGSDGKPLNAAVVPNGSQFNAEPLFTLRSSDPMAAAYVAHWAEMAGLSGVEPEKVINARATASAMRVWKERNAK